MCRSLDVQVYDIAFSRAGGGRDMFASVGADGSVRMFDLRYVCCFVRLTAGNSAVMPDDSTVSCFVHQTS